MNNFETLKKIQQMANKRVKAEVELDQKVNIIAMINSLLGEDKIVQTEAVLLEAKNRGYDDQVVIQIIERLKKGKVIYTPREGYIQRK